VPQIGAKRISKNVEVKTGYRELKEQRNMKYKETATVWQRHSSKLLDVLNEKTHV
jgi:hypothetical protein